jgi:hypothetical protein
MYQAAQPLREAARAHLGTPPSRSDTRAIARSGLGSGRGLASPPAARIALVSAAVVASPSSTGTSLLTEFGRSRPLRIGRSTLRSPGHSVAMRRPLLLPTKVQRSPAGTTRSRLSLRKRRQARGTELRHCRSPSKPTELSTPGGGSELVGMRERATTLGPPPPSRSSFFPSPAGLIGAAARSITAS